MNIHTLLRAAEYLEFKARAADEHGYACILPPSPSPSPPSPSSPPFNKHHKPSKTKRKKNMKLRRSSVSKGSHNELEKNRRAHLRECLDQLKKVVPLSTDSTRHTTLGLLVMAESLIKGLEENQRKHEVTMSMLEREKQYLLWNLNEHKRSRYRSGGHQSVSESSSAGSLDGSPFGSENDDVDVIGCPSASSSFCNTPVQSDSGSEGSISPVSVAMTAINQSFSSLL